MKEEQSCRCESCSKEKQDRVPIRRVIEKLDEHFSRNDLAVRVDCFPIGRKRHVSSAI